MERLLLFAKRPRLGKVKSRLVPPLSAEEALALYRAFLADQIDFLASFRSRFDVELCWDREQGPGDLGQRLHRAFSRSRRMGSRATVIIGSDSPTLPATHVVSAFAELRRGAPAVIAPADDGGFVLIGLREPMAELFRQVPWGGPQVFSATEERARLAGLPLVRLPPWYDIDDAPALERLRRELEESDPAARAPATARFLGIPGPVV